MEITKEVGGTHYELLNVQPIELIMKCDLTFTQGNMLKYISRYKNKNGAEDIKKCIHYAQLATRYGDKKGTKPLAQAYMYCKANNLTTKQKNIIVSIFQEDYYHVVKQCLKLIKQEYPNED